MDNPTCNYIFIARTALTNSETGQIEFKAVEKKFENENPILAREAAFAFRNEFLRGMLTEGLGLSEEEIGWNPLEKLIENISDREIRELINPFLEEEKESAKTTLRTDDNDEREIEWVSPDDSLAWYTKFNNGIWVVMKHNDTELHEQCGGDDNIVIDKLSRFELPLPTPPNYLNLQEEFKFYKKYKFDTKSYETEVQFFDDEVFLEGGVDEEGEVDEDDSLKTIEYLSTPFDWTGYDKIYWWEKEIDKSSEEPISMRTVTMEEAMNEGESQFCEFKPGLINRRNSNRDMECEIAEAICAFLNAKGGYLFIGVADNGEITGLDFSNISKDFFRREFTRIKTRYLPPSIAHTIYGEFYPSGDKEFFAITIFPCLKEPIFLRKKDDNNKVIGKEFYVRSDAASRHIYDIEEVVKYCISHWQYI